MKPSDVSIRKFALRRKLYERLSGMRTAVCRKKSAKIFKEARALPGFLRAQKIMAYAAVGHEVRTQALLAAILRAGKTLYLPRMVRKTGRIEIYAVTNLRKDLRPGSYGIPEPRKKKAGRGNPAELDLIFVPGLGFDRKGRRLGRGAGYYDRFLQKARRAVKIGLCFREQIVPKIPSLTHDVRMSRILSD